MNTLRYIHLFGILLISALSFGHPNDTVKQFKERRAALERYQCGCECSRCHVSDDPFVRKHACKVLKSISDGNEILSDEELQQNHQDACIKYFAAQFQAPQDSEQLITFCSEEAEDFVKWVKFLIGDR